MPFSKLGLCPELLQAVAEAKYTVPTPVQAAAIPPILLMDRTDNAHFAF